MLSKKEYFIQIESIRSTLKRMVAGDRHLDSRIAIINYNELGEIAGYVNQVVDNFMNILARVSQSAGIVLSSSRSLTHSGSQQSLRASEQVSTTTRIVHTMEEVDSHSQEIGTRARNVEDAAKRMRSEIDAGNDATTRAGETMERVRASHEALIGEVNELNERLGDIWEVVSIVSGIARKIRMIAFNATLQAAAAGRAGKSFEGVANEIRKLADETVSSSADIDERVKQVQSAAEQLVGSAKEDSEKIGAAWKLTREQQEIFASLLELSDTTAAAAVSMSERVSRQFEALGTVLGSLKSISAGTNEFSASIEDSNRTARSLSETVSVLEEITRGAVEV
ncbi:MAG: methyl-accepting chemotaxis protein [Spirochaetota bacterium]